MQRWGRWEYVLGWICHLTGGIVHLLFRGSGQHLFWFSQPQNNL